MTPSFPENLTDILEFQKVLSHAASLCIGNRAAKLIQSLQPRIQADTILQMLEEVNEYKSLLSSASELPLAAYEDLDEAFIWLQKEESVLEIEHALEIRNQSRQLGQIIDHFTPERIETSRRLFGIIRDHDHKPELLKDLDRVFNDEGHVKDNASPLLKQTRKSIASQKASIDRAFNKALSHYRKLGFLADNLESYRNGRRVLAVQAESKRKIKGLIHDESATGKTVFIEPEESILLSNAWLELKNDERREINRILRDLSDSLRNHLPILHSQQDIITYLDAIRARARQAIILRAELPHIVADASLSLVGARHPLLVLKHTADPGTVIPFNLTLNSESHIIVISGPNAGGKTITLKAVGLLQLMVQSGLLPPATTDSTFGIFHSFFADIGDQQSIEQDLSTYTSHLQNMKAFTEQSDDHSLILIDELGSGTEPGIGGAIAEAVLLQLKKKGASGVVTTHYANLKIVASRTAGLVNGSMEFDKKELLPTYRFKMGVPGSSYAFEMAKRSGLHTGIIREAKRKLGRKEGRLEDLLVRLQEEKARLDAKIKEAESKEKDLDRLTKSYDRLYAQLDVRRKKLKLDEKTFQLQEKTRENRHLEKVIREIREKENLESAKQMAAKAKADREKLAEEVDLLYNDIQEQSNKVGRVTRPIAAGDFVRMKLGGLSGQVEHVHKGKATIRTGNMTLEAPLKDLEMSQEPIELSPNKSIQTDLYGAAKTYRKLDIRGLRKAEALLRIEQFIDQALVTNLGTVEIIHGKGNGVLKSVLKEKLREYDHSFVIHHPAPEHGGEGVSIINLNG